MKKSNFTGYLKNLVKTCPEDHDIVAEESETYAARKEAKDNRQRLLKKYPCLK